MSRLRAEEVTLSYGEQAVVEALSASIPDEKITSIIGPNGCGKSTLLRALSRLMRPKEGIVILDGQVIHRLPTKEVARRLGLLPQQARAPEAITVEDLVRRGRYPHQSMFQPPSDKDHVAVERALNLAGVEDLRERVVDELSGGQRQRAWIAMTLAQDTPLILLDEPTTFLDIAHQHEVLDLVRRLNQEEGTTIVMVLHDINQAAPVSDHVIAMREGSVVAEGPPNEVITPKRLESIFGIETEVVLNPRTGQPFCIPLTKSSGDRQAENALPPRLRTDDLSLGYGRRLVVEGVSVAFPTGAVSAIVGPNACGKSTLFRALARLLPPKFGTALLDDRSVRKGTRRDIAQRLALLTQSPVSPPDVTVEDLVAGGRYPHQRWYRQWSREDESAVDAALTATALQDLRHRPVDALSGGQKQRAWVAMTLAQDTSVLLLDEPTTFLDIAHQVELLDLVRELNRHQGRTVIMVLHDLIQACRYADYIVAMKDGRIAAEGPPADIIKPELVREVFGIDCDVVTDPATGAPLVLPGGRSGGQKATTPSPGPAAGRNGVRPAAPNQAIHAQARKGTNYDDANHG